MYGTNLRREERAQVALLDFPYQRHYRTPYTLTNYEKAMQGKFYMKGYSGWGQASNEMKLHPLVTLAIVVVIAKVAMKEIF